MTIAIILSTHGVLAEQLLKTAEMIIGKQKNVAYVNLLPEENTEILIKKFNTCLSQLDIQKGVLFLIDTWGGSPFNAANYIINNKEHYDIITGINIPMLIEIFIERDDHNNTYQKLIHTALKSGIQSIKSMKYSPKNHQNFQNMKNYTSLSTPDSPIPLSSSVSINKQNNNHMNICIARIDDRLIHGQVVTRWVKEYKIQRIIVINDCISKDSMRKTLLTQVSPPGITAHVLDIEKAIRVYNNPKYTNDKVIMLFNNPKDVLRLITGGVPIKSINIGGMAFSQGKIQIDHAVYVNQSDIWVFKELNKLGIELEIRKVPSDTPLNLIKLLEKIK